MRRIACADPRASKGQNATIGHAEGIVFAAFTVFEMMPPGSETTNRIDRGFSAVCLYGLQVHVGAVLVTDMLAHRSCTAF